MAHAIASGNRAPTSRVSSNAKMKAVIGARIVPRRIAVCDAAVKAGEVEKAQALFPVERTYWERIEPVAEMFGDLDPAIDEREPDVAPGTDFTGFHRIEKQLWVAGDTTGIGFSNRLLCVVDISRRERAVGSGVNHNGIVAAGIDADEGASR